MQYSFIKNQAAGISAPAIYMHETEKQNSTLNKFFVWCKTQEHNHFLWLAIAFFGQIGLSLPLTAYSIIFFGGNNTLLWIIICAVNVPVLVLNLAALPTKTTLPFLFLGWLTQAVIIAYCIVFTLVS